MALTKTIELVDNFNITVSISNAYIKVGVINGNKENMGATVLFYKEKDNLIVQQKQYEFSVDLAGKNFFAQAYDYLKTLPEFAGAIDC